MSRLAGTRPAPAGGRPGDQDDICPVCKSSRYLNKSMRFLVNPECYHKMCESCVDRIFSHGPNKCPIAGCHRTLRKHRFRQQTFEDVQVEREVDIRRKVAAIFNQREEDFDSLDAYNNYLNDVEDMTFNLINKIDVEETERKMAKWAQDNAQEISANAALASQETHDYSALQAAEKEQARLRREAARREEEEERKARAEGRQDIINRLATGTGDADKIAEEGHRITMKRRLDKRAALERQNQLHSSSTMNGGGSFAIKGLKAKKVAGPAAPFDAFGGMSFSHKAYHALQDDYQWDWLDNLKTETVYAAGGYDVHEFYSRALCEAFSGLGVIIGQENAQTDATIATVSAVTAGTGAKDVKMEDPF